MPHRIHKCTNTLYDYALINTYVSLMYELKNSRNGFTSKFVGTGSSSCEKRIYRIYRAAVLQSLRNTDIDNPATREPWIPPVIISGVTLRSDDKDREYCLLSEEEKTVRKKKTQNEFQNWKRVRGCGGVLSAPVYSELLLTYGQSSEVAG